MDEIIEISEEVKDIIEVVVIEAVGALIGAIFDNL
jgi:hypothetical protein